PGVVLIDAAVRLATGGASAWDDEGSLASAGRVDTALLERLLSDPFFSSAPPRSTGRERFGPALVESLAAERGLRPGSGERGWHDLVATLTALTARSIAEAVERWVRP